MSCENVSDEELLQDIKNTEFEYGAYSNLQEAFFILSELPENQGIDQERYVKEYTKYLKLQRECYEFLQSLYAIRKERNEE